MINRWKNDVSAGNTVVTNVNYSSTTAKAYLMASADAPTSTATACEAKGD